MNTFICLALAFMHYTGGIAQSITLTYGPLVDSSGNSGGWIRKVSVGSTGNFPITRDTLGSFPDSIVVRAKMVDYTLGLSCGITCGCGSIKLKLLKPCVGYPYKYLYVGKPCFNYLSPGFKKNRSWKLYKLPITINTCYWTEVPMNKFDTKGLPFYTINKQIP